MWLAFLRMAKRLSLTLRQVQAQAVILGAWHIGTRAKLHLHFVVAKHVLHVQHLYQHDNDGDNGRGQREA